MGQEAPKVKKVLEINPEHVVLRKMNSIVKEDEKKDLLEDFARLLYDQAILADGGEIQDLGGFSARFSRLMSLALESK